MPSFFIAVSGACRRAKLRPDTAMNTGPCRFIPQQCKKSCGCPSTVEALHGALDLALAFAVLDHAALVVLGLALGKGDVALDETVLPVKVDGHQREEIGRASCRERV